MNVNRQSFAVGCKPERGCVVLDQPQHMFGFRALRLVFATAALRSRQRARRFAAFTLIEIMVVIGIMAIIFSLALPSFFREAHKDSMRKAVADLTEACSQARARAVLNGVSTEVRIRPGDRSINVVEGARTSSASGPSYVVEGDELVDRRASGGGSIFSAKLSDHILIEFIGVNLVPNLHEIPEVTALFYPNGTCDELVVLIRSDQGEIRKITTDVVTGIADVEVMK